VLPVLSQGYWGAEAVKTIRRDVLVARLIQDGNGSFLRRFVSAREAATVLERAGGVTPRLAQSLETATTLKEIRRVANALNITGIDQITEIEKARVVVREGIITHMNSVEIAKAKSGFTRNYRFRGGKDLYERLLRVAFRNKPPVGRTFSFAQLQQWGLWSAVTKNEKNVSCIFRNIAPNDLDAAVRAFKNLPRELQITQLRTLLEEVDSADALRRYGIGQCLTEAAEAMRGIEDPAVRLARARFLSEAFPENKLMSLELAAEEARSGMQTAKAAAEGTGKGGSTATATATRTAEAGGDLSRSSGIPPEWLKHRQYPELRALRNRFSGEQELFDLALERASKLTRNLDTALELLREEEVMRILANGSPQVENALKVAAASAKNERDIATAIKRVSKYISNLGPKFPGSLLADDVIGAVARGEATAAGRAAEALKGLSGKWNTLVTSATPEVQKALQATALEPKLIRTLEDSPEFARAFVKYLETAKDPAKFIEALNKSAATLQDTAIIGHSLSSETNLLKAAKIAEGGGDVAGMFARTSTLLRSLKVLGKSVPIVLDSLVVFGTVMDAVETANKLEELRKAGRDKENPELYNLYQWRYLHHGASIATATTGAVAGGLWAFGIGSTVAMPVTIATLPITAILYGAYESHKWQEDQKRQVADWKIEYNHDPVKALLDMRTDSFGERVGRIGESTQGNTTGSWGPPTAANPEELQKKLAAMNETKIRTFVELTTTVSVPQQVEGADGKPRDVTREEQEKIREEARQYVDARVQFILSQKEDVYHPIKSWGDFSRTLENSEYAGQLAKDKPGLEKERTQLLSRTDEASRLRAGMIVKVLEEKDPAKQAELYKELRLTEQAQGQYMALWMQLRGLDREKRPEMLPILEKNINNMIMRNAQYAMMSFATRCDDERLRTWMFPSTDTSLTRFHLDAPRITRLYGTQKARELATQRGRDIAKLLLAGADRPDTDNGCADFEESLRQVQKDIEKMLDPHALWGSLSSEDTARMNYWFTGRDAVPENRRKVLEAGEEYLQSIDANPEGGYYLVWYSNPFNKNLYITFENGKWVANLGDLSQRNDPSSFRCNMYGGTDKYNEVLQRLSEINENKSVEVPMRKAA
jgi:hypothetical protein